MAILTKTPLKNGYFHYQVVDDNGNVISERKSKRDYVAAVTTGTYYFGRLDLIGKGEHGSKLSRAQKYLVNIEKNPEKEYKDFKRCFPKSETTFEEYIEHETRWAKNILKTLNEIAYYSE